MGMIIYIGLGGAIGAVCRYAFASQFDSQFPWGILATNILGCLAMGVLAGLAATAWQMSPEAKAFLMTGVLGGFTTFSAFALDIAVLTERGDMIAAMLYAMASVGGSIAALFVGLFLVRAIFS